MRKRTRIYVGVKSDQPYEYFRSAETPTDATHGDKYNAVIGPFRTKAGAMFMVQFGKGNPHCYDVASAERLARQYKDEFINGKFVVV